MEWRRPHRSRTAPTAIELTHFRLTIFVGFLFRRSFRSKINMEWIKKFKSDLKGVLRQKRAEEQFSDNKSSY
jgi:hypothetical protein